PDSTPRRIEPRQVPITTTFGAYHERSVVIDHSRDRPRLSAADSVMFPQDVPAAWVESWGRTRAAAASSTPGGKRWSSNSLFYLTFWLYPSRASGDRQARRRHD